MKAGKPQERRRSQAFNGCISADGEGGPEGGPDGKPFEHHACPRKTSRKTDLPLGAEAFQIDPQTFKNARRCNGVHAPALISSYFHQLLILFFPVMLFYLCVGRTHSSTMERVDRKEKKRQRHPTTTTSRKNERGGEKRKRKEKRIPRCCLFR